MGSTEDLIAELVNLTNLTKEQLGALLALVDHGQADIRKLKMIIEHAAKTGKSMTEIYNKIRELKG